MQKNEIKKGLTIIHAEVTSAIETCPVCGSWKTIWRKGQKERWLRMAPIAMDMNKGFISAVGEHLRGVTIIFDHYHVSALMNKVIVEVRREQQAQLDEEGKEVLKGSRFPLLKNYEELDEE